ncbi:hypothetical protein NPIL_660091 [Nephila pilipes]|uniref:Uncharacterized protein n=1 Tax=Nephila pilipes TaxID=299642 RepID=A0A8X6IIH5_NEPPI|nr:hypothetical protein NPIL_660091 [Nephila pilipes]
MGVQSTRSSNKNTVASPAVMHETSTAIFYFNIVRLPHFTPPPFSKAINHPSCNPEDRPTDTTKVHDRGKKKMSSMSLVLKMFSARRNYESLDCKEALPVAADQHLRKLGPEFGSGSGS